MKFNENLIVSYLTAECPPQTILGEIEITEKIKHKQKVMWRNQTYVNKKTIFKKKLV